MPPFQLQYELNRRQRLIPHLVIWGQYLPAYIIVAGCLIFASVHWSPWLLLGLIAVLRLTKGFFIGLSNIITQPKHEMDILVEENGLGYLAGGERWWVPLDGVLKVGKIHPDVWTVFHYNGTVINIPVGVITDEQIKHLQSKAERRAV